MLLNEIWCKPDIWFQISININIEIYHAMYLGKHYANMIMMMMMMSDDDDDE